MRTTRLIATGAAAAAAGVLLGWPAWAAATWARYGRAGRRRRRQAIEDHYLPAYEVAESCATRVDAPAALTWAAATGTGLEASAVVRAIIHARERLLRVHGGSAWPPGGIVAQLRSWGWAVLAELPQRAIVLGTVTQPWEGDVRFRTLAPDAFAAFRDPGFVKIVVTIAVDPLGPDRSVARVTTLVATTDATARARFRRYWAAFSPGILLIRPLLLRAVRREAERRHREARTPLPRAPLPRARPVRMEAAR